MKSRILIGLLLISLIIGSNQIDPFAFSETELEANLKPLEIKGPVLAEVNETISFTVTSEGSPVKGATVSFAGFEKETNESGIASFQIDFAGAFKAIASKDGYKTNSTLLWVFPKGNEKFYIRSTKSVSDPQQFGNTISSMKMAGFDTVRIKAYYVGDDQGNIYPIIPNFGLSDEAVEIIKGLYPGGEIPYNNAWIRVPHDIHQKQLAWMISRAKAWGFRKIYLYIQVHAQHVEVGDATGKASPVPLGEARQRFLQQIREEILTLAEFAEEHGVDVFDFGFNDYSLYDPELEYELLSLYKNCSQEVRSRFSGKLAVQMVGNVHDLANGIGLREYNYSGFDYLVLRFFDVLVTVNTTSAFEDLVCKYIDFAEYLSTKYKIDLLPIYVASLTWSPETNQTFNEFMRNFNSSEDARIWFMHTVFNELLKRKISGVDAHPLWFFEMAFSIGCGEAYQKFSYWPTKKALNLVSCYFSLPWNKEGKSTLNMLRHAELAINSTTAESFNLNLTRWLSELLEKASKAYVRGEYQTATQLSQKILGFFRHIRNPLGITIDGDGSDWKHMDPIYFNPFNLNRTFAWFDLLWCREEIKSMGNLKSVYVANDIENLYLMLEFYGSLPRWVPYINIDVSGEWSHQKNKEFHVILHSDEASLWSWEYEGLTWPDPERPRLKLANIDLAYGDVIELKIPLRLIQNPEKLSFVVWYPWIVPWGDMEVDLIDWGAPSSSSSIFISTPQPEVLTGETISILGFIYPAHDSAEVTLTYEMPNGTVLIRNVISTVLGEFKDKFTPSISGSWTVKASWSGDLDHEGAESPEVSFSVMSKPAEFILKDLTINPTEAQPRQTVEISVKVINVGEQKGSYSIDLKVAGEIVDTKTVTLAGGESIVVTFELVKEEEGTFDVEVAGQRGAFTVKKIPPLSQLWESYALITAVAMVIIGVAVIMYKRIRTMSLRKLDGKGEPASGK